MLSAFTENRSKPNIVVGDADYRRLYDLAASTHGRFAEVAEELLSEMDRAEIVPAAALPPGVVQMGSTVTFRANGAPTRRVTLVYPGEADIEHGRISILTPIGTALIGLQAGQSISWTARDGRPHKLTVTAVE